jgi:hypothetical protein
LSHQLMVKSIQRWLKWKDKTSPWNKNNSSSC